MGNSGTVDFFPKEVADYPLNQKLVAGKQGFATIEVSKDALTVKAIGSEDGELLDEITIVKEGPRTLETTILIVFLGFAIIMAIFLFFWHMRQRGAKNIDNSEAELSDSYTKVSGSLNREDQETVTYGEPEVSDY